MLIKNIEFDSVGFVACEVVSELGIIHMERLAGNAEFCLASIELEEATAYRSQKLGKWLEENGMRDMKSVKLGDYFICRKTPTIGIEIFIARENKKCEKQ